MDCRKCGAELNPLHLAVKIGKGMCDPCWVSDCLANGNHSQKLMELMRKYLEDVAKENTTEILKA